MAILRLVRRAVVEWGLVAATAAVAVALVAERDVETNRTYEAMILQRANDRAVGYATLLGDTFAATVRQVDTLSLMGQQTTDAWLTGDMDGFERLRSSLTPTDRMWGPDLVQVAGLNAAGMAIWSSMGPAGSGRDLHDRDYFQALAADPARETAVGRPVLGRLSGVQTVSLARAMRDAQGQLRGVSVLALRASMLARLCASLNLEEDDVVTLVRGDGVALMQRGAATPAAATGGPAALQARYPITGQDMAVVVNLSPRRLELTLETMRATLRVWTWELMLTILMFAVAVAGGLVLYRRFDRVRTRAAALAQSDAWFRSVVDDMTHGILIYDVRDDNSFKISYANPKAAEIAGVPAAALIGRDGRDLLHPADRRDRAQRMAALGSVSELGEATYPLQRPDGSTVWIAVNSVRSHSPLEPERQRGVTVVRDVTDTHARDAALTETRAQLDHMLQVIPGTFYQLRVPPGQLGTLTYVSPSVELMFGVSAAQAATAGFLTQHTVGNLYHLRAEAIGRAGPDGTAVAEYAVRLPDRELWLRDTFHQRVGPDGVAELVGFLSDASAEHALDAARRAAETALQRKTWALTAYARSLETLMRVVSLPEQAALVCETIVTEPSYVLACVGVPEGGPDKPLRLLGGAGPAIEYMDGLNLSWSAERVEGRGPTGIAVREARPVVMNDARKDLSYAMWLQRAEQFGIRSTISVPCQNAGAVVGVLIVYAREADAFGAEELDIFQRLSDELGFVIALEQGRATLQVTQVARRQAEETLRGVAELGPGLLYRAMVHADHVQVLDVFGDALRVTHDVVDADGKPIGLGEILGQPDRIDWLRQDEDGQSHSYDYELQTADGRPRWLRNAVNIIQRRDLTLELVGYMIDVTQAREDALQRQKVATLLTMGELATGIAHELGQPLATISLTAENVQMIMKRPTVNLAAVSEKIDKILHGVERAADLLTHMRMFARNERRAVQPVNVADALAEALQILPAKLRDVRVVPALPADLPMVMGQPIALEQVLINLIGNAADAYHSLPHQRGGIVTVSGWQDGQTVVIRVIDEAGGIPPHILPRIFDPFFSTKPGVTGTGLGLALAQGSITEMGGTITASNQKGGAVFEIRLPSAPIQVGKPENT